MILSWNVRGSGRPQKRRVIRETIKQSRSTVLCLQETKQKRITPRLQRSICGTGYHGWFSKDAIGSSGGLLTCWNDEIYEGYLINSGDFSLAIKLVNKQNNFCWMLSNIYGPHNEHDRKLLFAELSGIRRSCLLPWVLLGDFNATRFHNDWKGAAISQAPSRLFNEFIDSQQLMEIKSSNRRYTWSNLREDPSLAILDRCFIFLDWFKHFPLVFLLTMTRSTSDHSPLLLQSKQSQRTTPAHKPFRFENF